jgi:integrase
VSSRPQYLFKRHGSDNWYVRFQPPGQKIIERSLGTSDLKLAEIAAMPLIREHKAFMYQRRPTVTPFWDRAYEPGLRMIDGEQVIVTERELQYLDASGNVIRREPNGGPAELLTPAPLSGKPSFKVYDDLKRPTPAVKNGDDALLETYIKHNGIDGYREREARTMWHIFKTVVNKPIAKCTYDDGVAIVDHLIKQAGGEDKIKRATLRRRMVPLVATVNLAIEQGKLGELKINPFGGVVGAHGEDSDKRKRFTDDDMVLIRANLHRLSESDQLLVRVLATTGVRRGEVFEIDNEQIEDGIRFCVVGTKTPQSRRRVPFPTDLLPFLPEKITGQLIPGRLDSASKRLRKWLDKIGITDPAKAPMHSFRHRAKRRLINADVPGPLIDAVGGWANVMKKNSGDDYGTDDDNDVFSITKVKEAIDKIGF